GPSAPRRSLARMRSSQARRDQRHTAGCPALEVRITYPFHPRTGQFVAVVGVKRHAGADHLVILQPDRTLALLPAWMIEPEAVSHKLVPHPRFPVERLAELHALVRVLLPSCRGNSPDARGAASHEGAMQP